MPMIGVIRSLTSESTIAAERGTDDDADGQVEDVPRAMKSRNPFSILLLRSRLFTRSRRSSALCGLRDRTAGARLSTAAAAAAPALGRRALRGRSPVAALLSRES